MNPAQRKKAIAECREDIQKLKECCPDENCDPNAPQGEGTESKPQRVGGLIPDQWKIYIQVLDKLLTILEGL